jgi:hypothetical protein
LPIPALYQPAGTPDSAAVIDQRFRKRRVYHGATLSIRRRMTSGVYFMLSYTFAHAIDVGQDALVVGRPATVELIRAQLGKRPKRHRSPWARTTAKRDGDGRCQSGPQ